VVAVELVEVILALTSLRHVSPVPLWSHFSNLKEYF
jgi:hypothetical protein